MALRGAVTFSHALIFVSDMKKMIAFYTSTFAFTLEPSSDDGFVFLRGTRGGDLALHRLPPQVMGELADPPVWREDSATKLCFAVENIDVARTQLLAAGGQARSPWSWEGTTFCECADPEGNVIQLHDRR